MTKGLKRWWGGLGCPCLEKAAAGGGEVEGDQLGLTPECNFYMLPSPVRGLSWGPQVRARERKGNRIRTCAMQPYTEELQGQPVGTRGDLTLLAYVCGACALARTLIVPPPCWGPGFLHMLRGLPPPPAAAWGQPSGLPASCSAAASPVRARG